jgi:NAD(P)-dependent dehydrogenase (short-subunit alcohol dehydrogenase family)
VDHLEKILKVELADWWRAFEVNILGTFLVTRTFLPLLLKHASSLRPSQTSPLCALTYWPGGSAYQISKLAVVSFAQILNP